MRKLNYLVLALILMVGMTVEVKASDADAACITALGKQQCVLSEDLVVSEKLLVQGEIELDLNGHTIRPTDTASDTTGLVMVLRDAKLTIKDSVGGGKIAAGENFWAAVQLTMFGETATGREATLVVESGTLEGYNAAVTGNGNRHDTNITINGGTLIATKSTGVGIYQPQKGVLVINGGTITGSTGIEIRSGSLTVNGGTITGNGELLVTPNGNGTTTQGVGIAIAQHTTKKDISVQIKGGEINGKVALYESNPQNNADVKEQVNVSITGGEFNAINEGNEAVHSEDLENFIVKGTFNKEIDSSYVSNIAEIKESNGVYTIEPDYYEGINDNVVEKPTVDVGINTKYESTVYTAPIETYDVDLSWDDLHWVFVYEGTAANPTKQVWLSIDAYETFRANNSTLSSNEVNGKILSQVNNLAAPDLNIAITNHSVFAVNVVGTVEAQNDVINYTNSAGLKIALDEVNPTYNATVNVNGLATNANANLLVRPTATRFVNDNGVSTTVAGEVNISFTKAN